ncbi:MAG TPA: Hsp20/alpha crystallin family protein [Thermoplasmata archaeon]|nr:Hsp20/alpha crystallin family protein [Thermoplasmata archaeon]
MVSEPSGEGEDRSPDAIDRIVGRLDAHRSLPPMGGASPPALGPPSPVADESRLAREPTEEIVVDPSWIYITLELRGASRESLEVTTTQTLLTVHALDAERRVFHREIELPQPVEPDPAIVTYRNGVLDVSLRRIRGHRIRFKRGI